MYYMITVDGRGFQQQLLLLSLMSLTPIMIPLVIGGVMTDGFIVYKLLYLLFSFLSSIFFMQHGLQLHVQNVLHSQSKQFFHVL